MVYGVGCHAFALLSPQRGKFAEACLCSVFVVSSLHLHILSRFDSSERMLQA